MNLTSTHEDAGQSLALLSGSGIWHCCELWYRSWGLDPVLLWLWCRLTAVAPIQSLAWEPPCAAMGAARKRKKKNSYENVKNDESIEYFF